jgi:hypothetical protein
MNAVVTLNLGNFLPGKARRAIQSAATRWHAAYVELTDPLRADGIVVHPFWQKTLIPDAPEVAVYDRLLVLDCDILIRSDCPSLFDLVPNNAIGVVSRVQSHRPRAMRTRISPDELKRRAARFGLLPYTDERQHLNGGLVLYHREQHSDILAQWRMAARHIHWRKFWWNDQAALSCILANSLVPVVWLPWTMNTLDAGRHPTFRAGLMETYIYHFNSPRPRPLAKCMEEVQWKLP